MKFFKYSILAIMCVIWLAALSPYVLKKAGDLDLVEDGYHYGDLYRLCLLSEFRDPRIECIGYTPPNPSPRSKKVHLYIVGDSFTEAGRIRKNDFAVDEYTYVHWSKLLHLKLDTAATNILLLESVERHFRQQLANRMNVLVPDTATFVTEVNPPKLMAQVEDIFKENNVESRLDILLFQNDLILGLKSLKADFNKKVFNRVDQSVTLVNGGKDVVYYMDTDTPKVTSSFSEVSDGEIDTIVTNLNRNRELADSLGFNEVILSVIPNKVSVISPDYGNYNRLIERVYSHPRMQIPVIDVLGDFRKMGRSSYQKGDSHWTCAGQTLWLNKTNALIDKLVRNNP